MAVGDITYIGHLTNGTCYQVWCDPEWKFLFTPRLHDQRLYTFSYDSSGNLTYRGDWPVWTHVSCYGDADYKVVFSGDGAVFDTWTYDQSLFMVKRDQGVGGNPMGLHADTTRKILFASDNSYLRSYTYTNNAILTLRSELHVQNDIYGRGIWADTSCRLVFALYPGGYGTKRGVNSFSYGESGLGLTFKDTKRTFGDGYGLMGIWGDSAYKLIFVPLPGYANPSYIEVYSYDDNGTMTLVNTISSSQTSWPSSQYYTAWADTTSKILVVGAGGGGIHSFSYDSLGNLTFLDYDRSTAGMANPYYIYGDADNSFLFTSYINLSSYSVSVGSYSYVGRSLRAPKIMQFF